MGAWLGIGTVGIAVPDEVVDVAAFSEDADDWHPIRNSRVLTHPQSDWNVIRPSRMDEPFISTDTEGNYQKMD